MDVMEMRFRMMAMIGGNEMLGELTQYAQRKITPNTLNYVEISNPLTVRPKIIIVSCADDSYAATTQNRYFDGVFKLFGTGGGQAVYINSSLANTSASFMIDDGSTSNNRIGVSNGIIRINRSSSAVGWSTETEYTFDIYG